MKKILIIGATSAIAQETARCFAEDGDRFFLVGRNPEKLDAVAEDLKVRGAADIKLKAVDLLKFKEHESLVAEAWQELNGMDIVLIAHGTLGDQAASQQDYRVAKKELQGNFLSAVSLLTPLANRMEVQGHGTLAVISSVAGDRGRQSNYIYGSAKAGLNAYLQGLRNRLYKKGVSVITIEPGFVDTPMTADLPKNPLFASARSVGTGIYRAIGKKKNIVYLPFYWRWIMLLIKMIPEPLFKRLSL